VKGTLKQDRTLRGAPLALLPGEVADPRLAGAAIGQAPVKQSDGGWAPGAVGGGGGGLSSLTSTDGSIINDGTLTDPDLRVGPQVVQGSLIPPVVADSTSATAQPSGAGPYTLAVAKPSCSVGDKLFLWVVTGTTITAPPLGFTLLTSDTVGDAKGYLYERVVDGTEATAFTVSMTANTQTVIDCVAVTGVAAAATTVGATAHQTGASSAVSPSLTTPENDMLVLYFQGSADASAVTCLPPSGYTELHDDNAQFGFRQASCGWIDKLTASSFSATFSTSVTGALVAVMVAVPSNNFQPLSKAEVLATGLVAGDLGAMQAGPDGKLSLAATPAGLFGSWKDLGAIGVDGWLTAVEYCPADGNRVLCGGDMLGVGLSTDGGDSWQPAHGFPSWEICSFTWNPRNPRHVWAGTLSGPMLSTDGGHTFVKKWTGMPTADFPYSRVTQKIVINPVNTNELWAFFGSFRGSSFISGAANLGQIYHSTDYGNTWTLQATITAGNSIQSAGISVDGSTLLCIQAGASGGIYRSTDAGATWTQQTTSVTASLSGRWVEPHPTNPLVWFACFDLNNSVSNILTSTDGGVTWAIAGNSPTLTTGDGYRTVRIANDGLTLWAVTASVFRKSTDGGATWATVSTAGTAEGFTATIGVAFGAIGISPNPNVVMFGTSGELIVTKNGGAKFTSASTRFLTNGKATGRGYGGHLGVRVKPSRFIEGQLWLCAYDTGPMLSSDNGLSWLRPTRTYDPFDGAYDVGQGGPNGNIIYALLGQAGNYDGLAVSTDGGVTFTGSLPTAWGGRFSTGANAYNAIRPVSLDGTVALATLYNKIWRTTDTGSTWAQVGGTHGFNELVVDTDTLGNGTTTTVYAMGSGGLYKSTDGGQTWSASVVTGSPTTGVANYMKLDPSDHTKLYIAVWQPTTASANQGLWRYDTGSGVFTRLYNNWSVRDVAVNPQDSNSIVITTDDNPYHGTSLATGPFWSRDGGLTWQSISTGLKMLRCWGIDWDPWKPGRVIMGLNGGGFWVTHLAAGGSAADERGAALPHEQLPSKGGYHEKTLSWPDIGTLVPGPLDTTSWGTASKMYPSQAPGAIQVNATQAASWSPLLEDWGGHTPYNAAAGGTCTLDTTTSPVPVGAWMEFSQLGAGAITFAVAAGQTLLSFPAGATHTLGQGADCQALKVNSTTWLLTGNVA
jgi:photosystem II stability/assembly factor-like uncharacterized protein